MSEIEPNKPSINWNLLAEFSYFFSKKYQYLEVPWVVDKQIHSITTNIKPEKFILQNSEYLVGSAEQSFLQLIKNNQLKPGNYYSITPCFREDNIDYLHQPYFIKLELFSNLMPSINKMYDICHEVYFFLMSYLSSNNEISVVQISDNQLDIEINKIEVGSYYYMENQELNISWVCGTGIALPRFTQALLNKN